MLSLTLTQQLLAKEEGWKALGGYVTRDYDIRGSCPFKNTREIVRFLREKGRRSDWHRDVYMALRWSTIDQEMAQEEGWVLHQKSIQRCTFSFFDNESAQAHVQAGINAGDPLCLKAIATLAKRRLSDT